jgi:hypothetical protein
MPIIARKKQSTYKPSPEGLHQAVCCDVWEPFDVEDNFNAGQLVTQTRIVWQIDVTDEKWDRPVEVSQLYRLSLHEKSKLCQHLEAWRGRKFTAEEKTGFDLEDLLGANCQIQVVHNIKEDGTIYANVQAIVPVGKNATKMSVTSGFTRKKDRQDKPQSANVDGEAHGADATPF